jgi:hypothetical protein
VGEVEAALGRARFMKKIEAIIEPFELDEVEEALTRSRSSYPTTGRRRQDLSVTARRRRADPHGRARRTCHLSVRRAHS